MENLEWPDGKRRCFWANPKNERYVRYHDEEWGQPVHDDGKLFEMLLLECFQAGLSWECILNKREGFRRAFAGFELEKVCAFTAEDVERLMQDAAIIRHRRKIEAAIGNARVFRAIQQEFGSFDRYLWQWTGNQSLREYGRTTSPVSDALAKDLKKRGMKFVGSTTLYSYLQAVGVIESHEPGCFLVEDKKEMQ
ncbi:DNA-3-methyladenine glycosylase I [uncultured Mitsuokella sp.]|uniref:DNA-3-methyladenine glycosylase I n=1 Tax=uncultured Mitsuokella sp. TaxID=453120 RepID=UPI0026104F25|nr:DNA-3-methyladenine glycosylase I [uncultured Mitsuokella sp.]